MRVSGHHRVHGIAAAAMPWMLSLTLTAAAAVAPSAEAVLRPETVAAWQEYVAAAEARMTRERQAEGRFLGQAYAEDAAERHRRLRAGEIVIDELSALDAGGEPLAIPSALVHHWRGAVFVPGLTARAIIDTVEHALPGRQQEDVLAARVLFREPGRQRVYLRLQRSKFVTVVLETEHDVWFHRPAPDRAWSVSAADRIVEVRHAGTTEEVRLPPGRDRGFLWRWNAYWRYQDVPGGAIVECESVSLSRDVPALVRYVAGPMIRSTARESMTRTLEALRGRLTD